ncbi:MAG: HesA/MoeB/ThiF family protein, partial [Oligosphaeraceae bacterium]
MDETRLTVTVEELRGGADDRFQRFSLMGWWDQRRIRRAKVLVIGAGALGNEIIKNLSLLGVGHLLIADLDLIENSNLSRSVLYRAEDSGQPKAPTAARSARGIFPDIHAGSFHGNVIYDLGLGVYRWADVVLAGLDNREARLSINRNCWKVNRPWIDGAIEQISGVARVFVPDGPCYECTMSETDWRLLNRRRSCNLLTRDEMEEGKVPTTPTISSVIAGVQCQEAVKLLHGMETLAGKGFVFNGVTADSYLVEYQRNEDCYSHDTAEQVLSQPAWRTREVTVRQALSLVREVMGEEAVLELGRDILSEMHCPGCGRDEELYLSLGKAGQSLAACPVCGARREV